MTKTCSKCNKEKLSELFTPRALVCKTCKSESDKIRYLAKREEIKAQVAQRKIDHPEYMVNYRLLNREKIRAQRRGYRASDSGRVAYRRGEYNRRLQKQSTYEPYLDNDIFERDQWICQLCFLSIDPDIVWDITWAEANYESNMLYKSIDHMIPLSLGGSDTPQNIRATHYRCNVKRYWKERSPEV